MKELSGMHKYYHYSLNIDKELIIKILMCTIMDGADILSNVVAVNQYSYKIITQQVLVPLSI